MEWYSWISPLGWGILILCLSIAVYFLSASVNMLTKAGKRGKEMEK